MKKSLTFLFLFCLLISACGEKTIASETPALATPAVLATPSKTVRPTQTRVVHTPRPTLTPSLTYTPSITSTPQPPLKAHSWQPEGVLIVVDGIGGDGGYKTVAYPPGFVLFFDGSLYFNSLHEENNDWKLKLHYVQLGRKGVCQFLNTIDQSGFLDYDPVNYQEPLVDGGPTTIITVNAWKRVSGTFYDLNHVVRGIHADANFPLAPALFNTYSLLSWYEPASEIYEPDRVALWIYENIWSREEGKPFEQEWKLDTPRLADLHSLTGSPIEKSNGQYVTYRGDIAKSIFRDLSDWNDQGVFIEDGRQYTVFAQVLLPYQLTNNFPEERGFLSAFSGFPDHPPILNCFPSDGIMPIPTPPQ